MLDTNSQNLTCTTSNCEKERAREGEGERKVGKQGGREGEECKCVIHSRSRSEVRTAN